MRVTRATLAVALLIGGADGAGFAQPIPPAAPGGVGGALDGPLQISLTPYVWGTRLSGHTTVRGVKADVDLSFKDIVENLSGAVMLSGELRKGRFAILSDTVFAQLEDSAASAGGGIGVDVTMNQLVQSAAVAYRLGSWQLADAGAVGPLTVTLDPYAGIRYTYLDVEASGRIDFERSVGRRRERVVSADRRATASQSQQWIDPIIGARTIWTLGNRLTATVAGDVDGFEVGSDFTWQAVGLVGYRFGILAEDNATLLLGYRALYQDYSDGSGRNQFEWDVTMHGPIAGLAIRF